MDFCLYIADPALVVLPTSSVEELLSDVKLFHLNKDDKQQTIDTKTGKERQGNNVLLGT